MPLSEFIWEARRLAELCNYPNNQEWLIRDTIVSGVYSLRTYQKCIDAKDSSLQDCINICQAEDAIRMQVQECRPECQLHLEYADYNPSPDSSMASNSLRTSMGTKIRLHRTATIVEHQTGQESTLRYARLKTLCGKCGKKGHLDSLYRSSGTPVRLLEAQDYSHPQSQRVSTRL